MSKCKWCGKGLTGRKQHCGDKCRMRLVRYQAAVTKVGAQPEQINPNTQPEQTKANKPEQSEQPANFGQPDCDCKHCQQHRATKGSKLTLNHGAHKTANELGEHEINRVSLPGDVDYIGAGSAIAIAGGTA